MSDETRNPDGLSKACVEFLRTHVATLNRGDIETAKRHVFFPKEMNDLPRTLGLSRLMALRPLTIRSLHVYDVRPVAPKGGLDKKHGDFASLSVAISLDTGRGPRSRSFLPVWWSPETKEFLVAASELVDLEPDDRL